jgi:hypothetical protein
MRNDDRTPSIAKLSKFRSRSISPENRSGAPGAGGRAVDGTMADAASKLGVGWKVSPSLDLLAGQTLELANIRGSGIIQHLWVTVKPEWWRRLVLSFYWDGMSEPSIRVPLGDFFALGWNHFVPFSSKFVVAAPYCGLNSYWPMPFRTAARVTLENISEENTTVFYSLDYSEGEIDPESLLLHATWHRSHPVVDGIHTLLDIQATGKYVGTYLAVGVDSPGWWGEGEFKFFMDGDEEYPTICGTGTEDFFGGAWDFEVPGSGYKEFTSDYIGFHQVIRPDGLYESQTRFGMYRWQDTDSVSFQESLRVTVQDLGWLPGHRYRLRKDDIASTAFWYALQPCASNSDEMLFEHLDVT